MKLQARLRLLGVSSILLAGFAQAPSMAGEPSQQAAKTPNRVVVKAGTAGSFKPPRPIEPACFDVTIASMVAGEKISFELTFDNMSSTPIKILGGESGCSRQGCIKSLGVGVHGPLLLSGRDDSRTSA